MPVPASDHLKAVQALDEEIHLAMVQIQLCLNLPAEKRAQATTRAHLMLGALEGARKVLTDQLFPEVHAPKGMTARDLLARIHTFQAGLAELEKSLDGRPPQDSVEPWLRGLGGSGWSKIVSIAPEVLELVPEEVRKLIVEEQGSR